MTLPFLRPWRSPRWHRTRALLRGCFARPRSARRPQIHRAGALVSAAMGIALSAYLPRLPSLTVLATLLLLTVVLLWRAPLWRQLIAFALAGLCWGTLSGHWQLLHRLPASLSGADIQVQGTVVGLPDSDARRERVRLRVEQASGTDGQALAVPLRQVLVSWYGGPPLHAGERWQLTVRVKPPRGFVNPGGLDYQLWLMRQGVDATAYVRHAPDNRRLQAPRQASLSHWRERIRQWLVSQKGLGYADLMQALLIGDRSGLSQERWSQLQRTGTNHLLAISGLHVGMVALVGAALGGWVGRGVNLLWHRVPAALPGHLLALLSALGYAALAGFSIPTQRALIMIGVVQWLLLRRRAVPVATGLLVAWLAVLARDPLATYDPGFWLSFTAVAVLMFAFVGRQSERHGASWYRLVGSQWVVFVGLLVPLLVLVQAFSVLAPVANVVAIPLVTFLVVPWLLAALVFSGVWPWGSAVALAVADHGLAALMLWLDALQGGVPVGEWHRALSLPALLLAALAALLILMPKGLPGRWLGFPALGLALCLPGPPVPPLRVTFLDVGQGLAVAVQTPDYRLVYDTGPIYSERLDAGSGILVPYWRRRGVYRLDAVVVSHRHDDHAGGLSSLLEAMPAAQIWQGEPMATTPANARDCHQGASWQWNQVRFRFLHGGFPERVDSNNRSCVLEIDYAGQRVLLTGDIEREVEWRLVGAERLRPPVQVLQVPHHGAETSSTREWVAHTQPELAVVSAAHQGRHGHPSPAVVARYQAAGAQVLNTATRGAIEIEWDEQGRRTQRFARFSPRRWWYQ